MGDFKMVKIIATSEIGDFFDDGRLLEFLNKQSNPYSDLLNWLQYSDASTWSATSITSTQIVIDGNLWGNALYRVTISGSGIDPISSFANFQAAVQAGLANGDFDSIVIRGQNLNTPGVADAEILNISLSPSGYTMTSGDQVISVTGSLPAELGQFYDLAQIAEQMASFSTLSNAQQAQIITDLNAYGISDLSVSSGGVEVFAIETTATESSLSIMGYKVSLFGDFPTAFGDNLELLFKVGTTLSLGGTIDFSDIFGSSITRLKIYNPDGDVILKTVGDLGTSGTIAVDLTRIDGVKVVNQIIGENTSNATGVSYVPGDNLVGTNGADFIFGLAGHDTLFGGKGTDTMFGGTGNDRLNGGRGDDVLNAGSNKGADIIYGSRGDDTLIFSDSGEGYQQIDYSTISRGIKVVIKGNANTGTVFKGNFGTDTLIDVNTPMKAGMVYSTGGFGIVGTAKNDKFILNIAKDGWIQVRGGDGVDSYDLRLAQGSITRLTMWDATNGANVDISTGTIADDGFGNAETLNIIDKGGQLEIFGTAFADTFVGSDMDERFILFQGNDTVDGGGGKDLVRYDRAGVDAVNVDLTTGTSTGTWWGQAFVHSLTNIENVRGSRDAGDVLIGNAKANKLEGRGGDDVLVGKKGKDFLQGDAGNDILSGGRGRDTLIGGVGDDKLTGGKLKDVFVFDGTQDEGRDRITDFQDGLDRIRIEGESFADLTIKQAGGGSNTRILLDSGTEIILLNVDKADIGIDDFIFV